MNYTFEQRKPVYTNLWAQMDIRPERLALVTRQADKIISFKDRYEPIVKATGVPYYVIGLMHLRESNFNFGTHLHNGDSLKARTYHVPAGRPIHGTPPFTFEESAIDALRQKGYDKITDWSIERIAYVLERYNGFGSAWYSPTFLYIFGLIFKHEHGKADNSCTYNDSYFRTVFYPYGLNSVKGGLSRG